MRHRLGALVVAAATGLMWIAVGSAPATATPTTQDFVFTGGLQRFVVPEGVCSVSVRAFGAEGGLNPGTNSLGGSIPGLGGEAEATLSVTPGDNLTVIVGGQGGDASGSTSGAGGFGGGGDGGTGGVNGSGGGGGASAVFLPASPTELVIAGGGGAAGDSGTAGEALGGDGGGATGGDGTGDLDVGRAERSTGGAGGAQSVGGAPGVNSDGTTNATGGAVPGGGDGGSSSLSGGGGGGGGFYGGGGGGAAATNQGASAGGGGGASFTPDGTGLTAGVNAGDGSVSITYEPTSDCGTPTIPVTPATPLAAPARFTG